MTTDILRDLQRVSLDLVRQASEFQAAILADVHGRRGAMHGRIAALRPRMKLAGPALTVGRASRRQPDDPRRHRTGEAG
jgi:regulator of RNase E activity RraA